MRKDKQLAIRMRRAGKRYSEISDKLSIPKSTLSDWFGNESWSSKIKNQNIEAVKPTWNNNIKKLAAHNKKRFLKHALQARREARKEFLKLHHDPLFIAGLMLYWGEGINRPESCVVKLTNTNPLMISVFTKFLTEICEVPKNLIRVGLIIYPDLNMKSCENFWRTTIGVPSNQFHKTQVIHGKSTRRKLSHGICMITISRRALKERILTWIILLQKELHRPTRQREKGIVSCTHKCAGVV